MNSRVALWPVLLALLCWTPAFALTTVTLSNGNYLIVDPDYDAPGPIMDVGAVRLYNGTTNALISTLTGGTASDRIGSGGVTKLSNGNFVVASPNWANGTAANAGAVTWGSSTTGISGVVSEANSLVGSYATDAVGSAGITMLSTSVIPNGYLVRSPNWNANAGAVTWCNNSTGRTGAVSEANSLVGSASGDSVGSGGITPLSTSAIPNGYLVRSPNWNANAGAVTWCNNSTGRTGAVSEANSLVGSASGDSIGSGGITPLSTSAIPNGYLVLSPHWNTDVGAVTWCNNSTGQTGAVSEANSLVGSASGDSVGSGGITLLPANVIPSGYLVSSPKWANSVAVDAGAVTWCRNSSGINARVSAVNSLVGSHSGDQVGSGGIAISGSNYFVSSPNWCYGAGALTPGSQANGVSGVVSSLNSTVGFESDVPQISLQQPVPTDLPAGSSRSFGTLNVGGTSSLTFTIKNAGTDDLLLTGAPLIAVSGTDATSFTVTAQPPSLIVTGGAATFTVRFAPGSGGGKTAALSIANNDSDESLFVVNLSGTALAPISGWRQFYFGSTANTGDGADLNDFDKDGISNVVEYAFGLNPTLSSTGQLPQAQVTGGNLVISFSEPAGITGITYSAEWSATMQSLEWHPVSDSGITPQHVFSVPKGANTGLFIQLKVTTP